MKNDTDTAALLPCPFCGGGAAYDFDNTMVAPYGHMLTCNRCATTSGSSPSKEHAIAAWNRRTTTPPTDDEREGLARAIEAAPNDRNAMAIAALAYLAPIRAREIAAAVEASEARAAAAERERDALRAAQQWQPIETAPKDETTVDLWVMADGSAGWRITDTWWHPDDGGYWLDPNENYGEGGRLDPRKTPTHWMRRSAPPQPR